MELPSAQLSVVFYSLQPHGLCGPPGSSVHRIFQARLLEWVAIAFSEKAAVAAKSLQSCPDVRVGP